MMNISRKHLNYAHPINCLQKYLNSPTNVKISIQSSPYCNRLKKMTKIILSE